MSQESEAYKTLIPKWPVGAKVRVNRAAADHECGWNNTWVPRMTPCIGKVGTIQIKDTGAGCLLDFDGGPSTCRFPWFVLEYLDAPAQSAAPTVASTNAPLEVPVMGPTTIGEWLDLLPQPYKTLARRNVARIVGTSRFEQERDSLGRAILGAFDWGKSPEGHSWWYVVHRACEEGDFSSLPPIHAADSPPFHQGTMGAYLLQLPDGYMQLAFERAVTADMEHAVSHVASALSCAFTWDCTPEGWEFWNEVKSASLGSVAYPPLPSATGQAPVQSANPAEPPQPRRASRRKITLAPIDPITPSH